MSLTIKLSLISRLRLRNFIEIWNSDQNCSALFNAGQNWSVLIRAVQHWSAILMLISADCRNSDQNWSALIRNPNTDQCWSEPVGEREVLGNNNNNNQPVVGSVLRFWQTSSLGTCLSLIVNRSVPPWILGEVLAHQHTFPYPYPPHLSWPMTKFPLTSNIPPFQPRTPLRTTSNHSSKQLLFIFPYCCCLPPPTSSAACACFHLSHQKSPWIHLPDSVWEWKHVHRTHTCAQQTLHPNSFNIIQPTQLTSICLQFCTLPKIHTLHFHLPYNGPVNPGISYPMLSPHSWQSKCLNTGLQRPYIIVLSTTTLPFVTPTQSAVGCPTSA